MAVSQVAIEIARILLENELAFLEWQKQQKEKAGSERDANHEAEPAQTTTPPNGEDKSIIPYND